jgi:hypothetical protein
VIALLIAVGTPLPASILVILIIAVKLYSFVRLQNLAVRQFVDENRDG